jgi:hypothetical protein
VVRAYSNVRSEWYLFLAPQGAQRVVSSAVCSPQRQYVQNYERRSKNIRMIQCVCCRYLFVFIWPNPQKRKGKGGESTCKSDFQCLSADPAHSL